MKKKAILTLTLAGLVALQLPMTALAIDHHGAVDNTVGENESNYVTKYSGGDVDQGSYDHAVLLDGTEPNHEVIITGNVTGNSDGYYMVLIKEGANATIKGNVTDSGTEDTIYVDGGSTVTVEGNVASGDSGVYASGDGTEVTVSGNVTTEEVGVKVVGGAKATVGDVTSNGNGTETSVIEAKGGFVEAGNLVMNTTGQDVAYGIFLEPTEYIDIKVKNITVDEKNQSNRSNTGISAGNYDGATALITAEDVYAGGADETEVVGISSTVDNGSTNIITVDNVTTNGTGIEVAAEDGSMTIIVNGTVKSTTYAVCDDTEDSGTGIYDIITSALDKGTGEYFNKETVADHVYYFVDTTSNTAGGELAGVAAASGDSRTISLAETGVTRYAIKENDATIIKVTEVDGYTFKSMSTSNAEAILTANSDGTYTLTMPRGGNVSLDLVYEVIRKQEEQKETQEEKRATITGSDGNAVTGGQWNVGPGGYWTYRNNGIFKDTWGYITLANGKTGWFWFDKSGVMATGWKQINNKWYYFNEVNDGTQGMMLTNTTTPDGFKVGADGVWIQ